MPKALRCIHRPLAGGVKLGPDGKANTTFALQLRDSSGPAAKRPQSSHRGMSPAPRFTGPGETARRTRGLLQTPASPQLRERLAGRRVGKAWVSTFKSWRDT